MNLKNGLNLSIAHAKQQENRKAYANAILDRVSRGDDLDMQKNDFHELVTWALKQTGDL